MCCVCGGGEDDGAGEEEGCPEGTTEYTWSYEGSWSSEVSWDLVDAINEVAASGDGTSGTACIADGEYTANMYVHMVMAGMEQLHFTMLTVLLQLQFG